MTSVQLKIAQRRELLIVAEGLAIEIAMALGSHEEAGRHRVEMEALLAARSASLRLTEEEGGCFFPEAGTIARLHADAQLYARQAAAAIAGCL